MNNSRAKLIYSPACSKLRVSLEERSALESLLTIDIRDEFVTDARLFGGAEQSGQANR